MAEAEPITFDDLKEYLAQTDEFDFELATLRACRAAGWATQHGRMYRDHITGKDRQYDIRAWKIDQNRLVQLAIECKRLKPDFPLLVSRTERDGSEAWHQLLSASMEPGFLENPKAAGNYFRHGQMVGKSMNQVSKSGSTFKASDKDVFDKWAQATSSAAEWLTNTRTEIRPNGSAPRVVVSLPVLVVPDGCLWAVDYGLDGNVVAGPAPATEIEFILGKTVVVSERHGTKYEFSHLIILTSSGLPAFLRYDDFFYDLFPRETLAGLTGNPE